MTPRRLQFISSAVRNMKLFIINYHILELDTPLTAIFLYPSARLLSLHLPLNGILLLYQTTWTPTSWTDILLLYQTIWTPTPVWYPTLPDYLDTYL